MIRRISVAACALIILAGSATSAEASARPPVAGSGMTTYRVVGTGDSILHMVAADGTLQSQDRWFDTEQGRQAYIRGNMNRASTWEIWDDVVANSRRGGWLVVQDNAAEVTQTAWRTLIRDIVAATPNDRCLLGVLPVIIHPDEAVEYDIAVKANIMVQEFAAQPCTEYVRWNQAVTAHPEYVYDGTHPTPAGIAYLSGEIDRIVGYRVP